MSFAIDRGTLLPPSLRQRVVGRGPVVLIGLHEAGCDPARAWLDRLADAVGRAADWGGRIFLLTPDDEAAPANLPPGLTPLQPTHPGLDAGAPFVVVTDEWGEVFFGARAEGIRDLPDPDEVVDWVRFAAIQCPECENPEGGWRSL